MMLAVPDGDGSGGGTWEYGDGETSTPSEIDPGGIHRLPSLMSPVIELGAINESCGGGAALDILESGTI